MHSRANQSSLGSGLLVTAESEPMPHHLNRQRIAHDVADMHPDTFSTLHETVCPTVHALGLMFSCLNAVEDMTGGFLRQPSVL